MINPEEAQRREEENAVDVALDSFEPMRDALIQLLLAFAKGAESEHVEWEDIEIAVDMAKDALPGEYERILGELAQAREE